MLVGTLHCIGRRWAVWSRTVSDLWIPIVCEMNGFSDCRSLWFISVAIQAIHTFALAPSEELMPLLLAAKADPEARL